MKDYKRVVNKIMKMGKFSDIHQCGSPSQTFQVNLYCELSEPYVIGYKFYVAYSWNTWSINYSLDNAINVRTKMEEIRGMKTEVEMYAKVEEIINIIREKCNVA